MKLNHLKIPWPVTVTAFILLLNIWIQSSLYETLSATLAGVFLAIFFAQEVDKIRRKEKLLAQIISVANELGANDATLTMIRENLSRGFALDRLTYDAADSMLLNSDLYQFADNEFVAQLIIYKKTTSITNNAIDFCFERWKEGKLNTTNKRMLLEKFKAVDRAQRSLTSLASRLQVSLKNK